MGENKKKIYYLITSNQKYSQNAIIIRIKQQR